jgi:glycosyltransferase involved in cell wall biosynthesis
MQIGLVSVIIPVFNRGLLLREAVRSVVEQTYRPLEIIVVDDGSTDDTADTCRELAQMFLGLVQITRQANAGPGVARETGRLLANGEFIQYLDSDDRLLPHKIERQVELLRKNPDCGVAYCKTREYTIGEIPADRPSFRTGERLEQLFPILLSGRCWQTVTPLFRRSVCDQVGPWTDLRQEEDWEYDARVASLGTRLVWCPEYLAEFRHHEGARASGDSIGDPRKMRWRYRAHVLIYLHACRYGISRDDSHMRRFARELFLLTRQCGAVGLAAESRELFLLAREASDAHRARGIDFRLYSSAVACLGWTTVGRLCCWLDRLRPRNG